MTGSYPSTPTPPLVPSDAESIRRAHIAHEASIKSIGILYFLGAAFLFFAGAVGVLGSLRADSRIEALLISVVLIAFGAVEIAAGIGIRKFAAWAKFVVAVISALGLLAFPVGTIINGYILYLLFSKKGAFIFSPEYQHIIATTPDVKYKTSILVWIFLGFILLLVGFGVVAAVVGMAGK